MGNESRHKWPEASKYGELWRRPENDHGDENEPSERVSEYKERRKRMGDGESAEVAGGMNRHGPSHIQETTASR